MVRTVRRVPLLGSIALLFSLQPGYAQWPGLPERPGSGPERSAPRDEQLRMPGQQPRRGFWDPPQAPVIGEGPRGTAPRTGTGLGLWEALTAMALEDASAPRAEGALESRPDQALMLRYTDEVALRRAGEQGWDILAWWRKIHTLSVGFSLRLDARGRVLLAFHDGAALECRGTTLCEILSLDREGVQLRFEALQALTLDARERPFRLLLPGGYTLAVSAGLVQVRTVAPRRIRVENLGPGPAVVQDGERELVLEWNQTCTLPSFDGRPPQGPLPPGPGEPKTLGEGLWRLSWEGRLAPEPAGRGWQLQSGAEPGWIQWGDSGFGLPAGARLRLVGPAQRERPGAGL